MGSASHDLFERAKLNFPSVGSSPLSNPVSCHEHKFDSVITVAIPVPRGVS